MILLVEDDINTRHGLSDLLRSEGYEVASASDATKALKILDETIKLLITDLHLPDFSGLELLQQAVMRQPDLRGIVITAYASAATIDAADDLPIDAWLCKPLNLDDFLERVAEFSKERIMTNTVEHEFDV